MSRTSWGIVRRLGFVGIVAVISGVEFMLVVGGRSGGEK
jgi:hypothetical protein